MTFKAQIGRNRQASEMSVDISAVGFAIDAHSNEAHDQCETLHVMYKPIKCRDSYLNGIDEYFKGVVMPIDRDNLV